MSEFNTESGWNEVKDGDFHDFDVEPTVKGVLTAIDHEVGENKSTVYTFNAGNGVIKKVWGATVLDSKMLNVKVGYEVGIEFLGRQKVEGANREFKNYNVFYRETPMLEVHEVGKSHDVKAKKEEIENAENGSEIPF